MKELIFIVLLVLISVPFVSFSQASVNTSKGENKITIQILNLSRASYSDLKLRFGKSNPSWLVPGGDATSIVSEYRGNYSYGRASNSSLVLPFNVLNDVHSTNATLELISSNSIIGKFNIYLASPGSGLQTSLSKDGESVIEDQIEEADQSVAIPTKYALAQNYPNPFNPSTIIQFDLPEPGLVTLRVFDLLGREAKTLVNSEYRAGFHRVAWNGRNLLGQQMPTGIYICHLITSKYKSSKKMLLTK
ncbi:MAG: T9SS type A sorting domain-containing protein [bacterium]